MQYTRCFKYTCTYEGLGLLQHSCCAPWAVWCLAPGHLGSAQYMYWHFSSYQSYFYIWSNGDLNQEHADSQPKALQPELLPIWHKAVSVLCCSIRVCDFFVRQVAFSVNESEMLPLGAPQGGAHLPISPPVIWCSHICMQLEMANRDAVLWRSVQVFGWWNVQRCPNRVQDDN